MKAIRIFALLLLVCTVVSCDSGRDEIELRQRFDTIISSYDRNRIGDSIAALEQFHQEVSGQKIEPNVVEYLDSWKKDLGNQREYLARLARQGKTSEYNIVLDDLHRHYPEMGIEILKADALLLHLQTVLLRKDTDKALELMRQLDQFALTDQQRQVRDDFAEAYSQILWDRNHITTRLEDHPSQKFYHRRSPDELLPHSKKIPHRFTVPQKMEQRRFERIVRQENAEIRRARMESERARLRLKHEKELEKQRKRSKRKRR